MILANSRRLTFLFVIAALGFWSLTQLSSRSVQAGNASAVQGRSPLQTQNSLKLLNRLGIGSVNDVYWSSDGQQMAFIGPSGIWTYPYNQQGKPQRLVDYTGGRVYLAALNPTWTTLAIANQDKNFQIWDLAAHRQIVSYDDPAEFEFLAVSPDGKFAASFSSDRVVRLWDAVTGKMLKALTPSVPGQCFICGSIAFTPDGKLLATTINYPDGSDADGNTPTPTPSWKNGDVLLWDLATLTTTKTLKSKDEAPISHITFSPDGKQMAAILNGGSEESYQIWDLKTGALKQSDIFGLGGGNLAFSPDGKLLAMIGTSEDSSLALVDLATGTARFNLSYEQTWGGSGAFAFSPNGRLLAHAGNDGAVRVWRTADGSTERALGVTGDTEDMIFSPDGKTLATVSGASAILLWDVASGALKADYESHPGFLTSVAFTPDGKFLVTGNTENKIQVYNAATGKVVNTATVSDETYSYRIDRVLISPDGNTLITYQFGNQATQWELPSLKKVRILPTYNVIGFSPDGKTLAIQTKDSQVALLDMASGALRFIIPHQSGKAAFNRDGLLLAIPEAEHIYLWRTDKNELAQTLTTTEVGSMSADFIAFKADGKSLVTVYSLTDPDTSRITLFVRLWDIDKPGSALVAQLDGGYSSSYALSPDSKILATTSSGDIALWALP